jgi:LacI family transcriptional regulator
VDVAILGVDNDELVCLSSYPPLSSIALDFVQAGFDAARVLHELMARRRKPAAQGITIKATHILTRQSTDILAADGPVVRQAVRFILTNRRKPIQVPDVLQQVTVSRRSLYDRFERVLGCSVYQFIKRVRIREIDNLVGFSTPEHIASCFRSVRGINPLALRRKRHGR